VDSLAVGQIGVLDAKTMLAVTAPTYAKNKALKAVWGTPNISNGDFFGAPNENEYSKLIKGKKIKRFRAKAARRGQTPVYTLGWSGDVSDTDTLTAKPGEIKTLWVKLSGTVIDRLYTTQGLVKQIVLEGPCIDNCSDTCENIPCPDMARQIVDKIGKDKDLSKFIRTKALISCDPAEDAPTTTTCYRFILTVCDTGDGAALGVVAAQYPNETITVLRRAGALTTYIVTKDANSAPAAFSQQGVFIPECPTCPTDYTLIPKARTFQVKVGPAVSVANVQAAFTGDTSVTLVNHDPEFRTYMVTFPTTIGNAAVVAEATTAGYIATEIGIQENICQQTTPTTVAWAADGTRIREERKFRITLMDSVCGTDRLADLQAAYPTLVVSVVDAAGSCVHTYETTVKTNCYEVGCGVENITVEAPQMFEGAEWKAVVPPVADPLPECQCGVQFETAFFHTPTGECSFDAFPYENDVVHIQISQYNPDFNADPCEGEWAVKQIRGVEYPRGHGQFVRKLEQDSKRYDLRHRSADAVVRELEGYSLQADPNKFYDQYVLEFDTEWFTAGGWSEKYIQSFSLMFFVPEGTGAAIETLFNSYLTSAGIEEDGAVI
jgi:hypothetical protein